VAVAFVKQAIASSAAGTTTVTCTLGSAPAAGNLLVFAMGGDKNTGALTLAGFTQAFSLLSTSVSLYYWWKVSAGTETAVSPSWAASSVAGNMAWYAEYADAAVPGSTWAVVGQASAVTTEANVLTQSTGTTAATTATGLGIAAAAVDSSQSVTIVSAWGNTYATRYSGTGGAGRGGVFTAEKAVPSGTAAVSAFNYMATADQVSAAIAVFQKVPSAGTMPEVVMAPHRT